MRDAAAEQLAEYSKNVKTNKQEIGGVLATATGRPIVNKNASVTVGPRGPLLLQDTVLLDEMSHFDRERIPERAVHAKGAGAFGYFEVTDDIRQYTNASVFSAIGKRTSVAVRFSTVGGESGSADTVRDPRGFAVKFYSEDGNWDLVGNNTPIFFIRDGILFPSFIHTQKRNPQTHLKDADMFWDFLSLRPESTHQVSFLFSDRGIPDGYRHMNGYGSHTFKLVNASGDHVYCKFHFKTDQGIQNLLPDAAADVARDDPDYGIRDLFNAISNGQNPSWTLNIQVMTQAQAESLPWNPFDVTKVWPHADFPLIRVGKMVLDRNPENYFAEVEQLAFNPANMIPGVEASPDKMLQARLFSYGDTQRHRLGPNHLQIPVNCPMNARTWGHYQRDGFMAINGNHGNAPNYFPNSFSGPSPSSNQLHLESTFPASGDVARYNSGEDDNFSQVTNFWRDVLTAEERQRLASNIAGHLGNAQAFIQQRAIANFSQVDPEYGQMISDGIKKLQK